MKKDKFNHHVGILDVFIMLIKTIFIGTIALPIFFWGVDVYYLNIEWDDFSRFTDFDNISINLGFGVLIAIVTAILAIPTFLAMVVTSIILRFSQLNIIVQSCILMTLQLAGGLYTFSYINGDDYSNYDRLYRAIRLAFATTGVLLWLLKVRRSNRRLSRYLSA